MDDEFDHWIDKSGRTLSLSNIIRDRTGEQAAWHALTELGYAAVAWDESGVRVRVAADGIDSGTVDGLTTTLQAVRRAITLQTWTGSAWAETRFDNGRAFAADLRAAIDKRG